MKSTSSSFAQPLRLVEHFIELRAEVLGSERQTMPRTTGFEPITRRLTTEFQFTVRSIINDVTAEGLVIVLVDERETRQPRDTVVEELGVAVAIQLPLALHCTVEAGALREKLSLCLLLPLSQGAPEQELSRVTS